MIDRGWTGRLGVAMLMTAAAMGCAGAGGQGGATPTTLVGAEWLAEDIGGRGVVDRAQSTVAFDADQAVYGSTGCNRFRGSATISGQDLRFGPLATTKMACPPAQMDQERKFLDALEATRSYRFDGPYLYFLDAGGAKLVKFTQLTSKTPPQ